MLRELQIQVPEPDAQKIDDVAVTEASGIHPAGKRQIRKLRRRRGKKEEPRRHRRNYQRHVAA